MNTPGLDFQTMPDWTSHSLEILGHIDGWAKAYEVDYDAIARQIPIAYQWTKANPRRAPKKDIVRFLFNWMRIAKSMGNLTSKPRPLYRENPIEEEMTYEELIEIRRRNLGGI